MAHCGHVLLFPFQGVIEPRSAAYAFQYWVSLTPANDNAGNVLLAQRDPDREAINRVSSSTA